MQDSVTVHMQATPDQVWALVSDVTRIGEFSPETFKAEWTEGATGPAVGARFRAHVKRNTQASWLLAKTGPTYSNVSEVLVADPGKEFTFGVLTGSSISSTWGYKIDQATDGGCDVTEFFHLTENLPLKIYWTFFGWARGNTNRKGMRTTLERIKAVVEAEHPAA